MKTIKIPLILTFITLLAAGGTARAISIVGTAYDPATTHTYYLLSPATWEDAELFSETLGGHLAAINDAAENTWIDQTFLAPNPAINPYIGLYNPNFPAGTWSWTTGEAATYLPWAPGEPNFSWEHWSNLYPANHPYYGLWNNASDSDVLYSIAEVPEPSTTALALLALGFFAAKFRRR